MELGGSKESNSMQINQKNIDPRETTKIGYRQPLSISPTVADRLPEGLFLTMEAAMETNVNPDAERDFEKIYRDSYDQESEVL